MPYPFDPIVQNAINSAAQQYGVDPALLSAMARQESGGRQSAVSPAGAIGVMQLMPGTAQGLGVNPYDLQQNVNGGANYMSQMLKRFGGNRNLALAGYNAGPGNVKGGVVPNIPETQNYVRSINAMLDPAQTQVQSEPASTGTAGPSLPATQQQRQSTYGKWKDWLSDDDNRAALLQFGITLMQPMPLGQNALGQLGQAIGEAGAVYGRRAEFEQEQQRADLAQREQGLRERIYEEGAPQRAATLAETEAQTEYTKNWKGRVGGGVAGGNKPLTNAQKIQLKTTLTGRWNAMMTAWQNAKMFGDESVPQPPPLDEYLRQQFAPYGLDANGNPMGTATPETTDATTPAAEPFDYDIMSQPPGVRKAVEEYKQFRATPGMEAQAEQKKQQILAHAQAAGADLKEVEKWFQ